MGSRCIVRQFLSLRSCVVWWICQQPLINISSGLGTPRTAVRHAICHLWFAIYRILSPHPKHLGPQWAVRHTMAPPYCLMIHRCLGARECPFLRKRLIEADTCELSGQARPARIPTDETSRPQLLWSTSMMLGSAAWTTALGSSRLAHALAYVAASTLQQIDLSSPA